MRRAAPTYLLGMGGLGDSIYQRPLVRAARQQGETYLSTPWPELYADMPGLRFVKPWRMRLRTQAKNIERNEAHGFTWDDAPHPHVNRTFWYNLTRPDVSILQEMADRAGITVPDPLGFDLPDFGPAPLLDERPIAVLRPVTTRREWVNNARAPLPEYIARAGELLMREGFCVVVVADIAPPDEWLEGAMPPGDVHYTSGELSTLQLMALLQHAAVIAGGVGFIVPAALAANTPAVIIAGGQGGHNAPERVVHPRMDSSRLRWVMPDHYCLCRSRAHACEKQITGFDAQFLRALEEAASACAC